MAVPLVSEMLSLGISEKGKVKRVLLHVRAYVENLNATSKTRQNKHAQEDTTSRYGGPKLT